MSLTFRVDYLCGWSMATHPSSRTQCEWPPHPDRIFMALAAAFFETDQDPHEKAALEWLESLSEPELYASDYVPREVVSHFVPVNVVKKSSKSPFKGLDALPDQRSRQERHFPVAVPELSQVYLCWPEADASVHREALENLCAKVIRIGHSSSLCQLSLIAEVPRDPRLRRLIPRADVGLYRLRVPGRGRLEVLSEHFAIQAWPPLARYSEYALHSPPPKNAAHSAWSSEILILEGDKQSSTTQLSLGATLKVITALRSAIFKALDGHEYPVWLSGHERDGRPSRQEHLAMFPLAFVDSEYADGGLQGIGLALPRGVDIGLLAEFLFDELAPRQHKLFFGSQGEWFVRLQTSRSSSLNLRPEVWTRPSKIWSSVTPVVLNRHPRRKIHGATPDERAASIKLYFQEVEQILRDACAQAGLPPVNLIEINDAPFLNGVPACRDFPAFTRKDGFKYRHFHVEIEFQEKVEGPILLGAGRFRGYGLMRPHLERNKRS